MGAYNLKVYEYADSLQIRMYDKAILYSEKVKSFRTFGKEEDFEEPFSCFDEQTEEQKKRSIASSKSRTVNQIYEIARANTWDYFLTLTFDRKKIDSSDYELLCNKVSIWLNNIKKRYAPDLKYIIVPELHSDGIHYHFHGLLANIGDMKFSDSGIIKNGKVIYNLDNWKYGFSTVSKVVDTGKASSYITKYITKELCVVGKNKKRYWCSQNCDRAKVKVYNLPYEELSKFFDDNIHLIRHTSEVVVSECGLSVCYVEMAKGI